MPERCFDCCRSLTLSQYSLIFILMCLLIACRDDSKQAMVSENDSVQIPSVELADMISVVVTGVAIEQGIFDAAPTVDAGGTVWMSYSHVSTGLSGITKVETRLATTSDGGLVWQDAGVILNAANPTDLHASDNESVFTHEVSRLIYNPYALDEGVQPWLLLWHRYLVVFDGNETERQFQHGWIAMKTGATPELLSQERKLFSGRGYDEINNDDTYGEPEYPLHVLYPDGLGDCLAFSEPAIMPKPAGLYISMLCAKASSQSKIVLLRCAHDMSDCRYLGDFIEGREAETINEDYGGFSAPELVSSNGRDYLIVTPVILSGNIYRGCVVYSVIDYETASIEGQASMLIPAHGDFNGACGYIEQLTASGIVMSEAFFNAAPRFRLFATQEQL